MSRSRTRRIAKWTGLVVCVLLVVVMVASHCWWVKRNTDHSLLTIESGGVFLRWTRIDDPSKTSITYGGEEMGWSVGNNGGSRLLWRFAYAMTPYKEFRYHDLLIPLWAPLLAIAIPTFILWRRDRRHPPGHCQRCGYDLTGNVTGVCSECEEPISIEKR